MVKQALRNQKLYFDDIETRLPLIEGFLKQIQEQQEEKIAPQTGSKGIN